MPEPGAAAGTVSAEVLAVGDELLAGDVVNGNAAWLSARLAAAGVPVVRHTVVGDDVAVIAAAVRDALARVPVLIVTGGLGPTQDDLTREALAAAAGVPLRRDPALEATLVTALAGRGRAAPARNLRQADLPVGATALGNPAGTAPGVRVELGGGVAYALPGVPHEMRAMLADTVLPDLAARVPAGQSVAVRVLQTAGMWEAEVAEAMAPEVARVAAEQPGTAVSFLAEAGQTRVKVTAVAPTAEQAAARLEPVVAFARRALGRGLVGEGDVTLAGAVVAALRDRGETLAVAESVTGGLLAGRLTGVAGASAVLRGGVTPYATDLKAALLGVPGQLLATDGAVSAAAAAALATGVRDRLGATWGLATTGVAGPDTAEGRPVGTAFLGLAGPRGVRTRALALPGDRERVRAAAVVAALDWLRRVLAQDEEEEA